MRVVLASVLSLMLAAAPAMGADALKPYAGFSQDGKHVMILVPADRLDDIQRELANAQDLTKDVMVVMPFEQFSRVASSSDISTSASPSREQTSVQTSESTQATTQSTQPSAPADTSAAGSTSQSTASSQALMQPSSPTQSSIAQSGSGYPAPAGPGGTTAGGTSGTTDQSASASGSSLPSSGTDTTTTAQSGTGSSSTTTTTERSTSTYSSQSASSPGASSSASAFSPSFENKAILLVPYDQLGGVSQAAGSEILVVIPYDKFHQVADMSKLQSSEQAASSASPSREQTSASGTTTTTTTQSSTAPMSGERMAWSEFHRDHVMLLVPADKLKSFSQISTTGERPIYVLMPLDQFNRVVEIKTESSREQTSFQPSSTATTTTTTTTTALPPAYADDSRTFFLHNLQEANSVLHWEPVAAGTIVALRDGSVLMVPDSVKIRGALQTGARVRGEYEQRGGQNLVTWLEVIDLTNNN